jgi:hypothetical protein
MNPVRSGPARANPANPLNIYLTHFALRENVSLHCSDAWFKAGVEHLKAGGDSASWHVLMYGA